MSAETALRKLILLLALWSGAAWPAAAGEQLELRIHGVSGEPLDNVRAAIGLERRRGQPGLGAESIRELHDQAPGEIARALEPFGFYRPEIEAELQEPARPGEPWRASYRIDTGPPLPVAEVKVGFDGAGATDPELAVLAGGFTPGRGEPLDHRRYETAKRELLQRVREHGYRDAGFDTHRVDVDLDAYEAYISLHIRTGPRYVIGPIEFEQTRFDPEYLERYLILQPGQPYKSSELIRQRQLFGQSGYFREVEIQPLPATAGTPPAVPLRIRLQAFEPNRYRGSLGWGTDTGFGTRLDWTRRYLGGRGQRFNLSVAAVENRNRLAGDLSYLIPLEPLDGSQVELLARHESKDLTYGDVGLDEGGDTRIATNLLSGFWHLAGNSRGPFDLEIVPGLSLVTESYDVFEVLFGNLPAESQRIIIDRIGREAYDTLSPDFEALVASLRLTLRRSDDRLFIRDGDYFRLELLGSDEQVGSNIGFWQSRLNTWHIRPLLDDDRLLLRTAFGYSDAESRDVLGARFNQMPEYYEFRAGGVRSVRGYGWEELVPADAITGGKHLVAASIEYEHEIVPDWSASLFFDAGNAFNDFDDIDPKLGTGIGLRWRSPVGLVRIDLGIPLDDGDDSFQVYITVGPEF